jgi:ribonuclease HII
VSFYIGVDENGLGPQLGPMVVTAVMASVREGATAQIDPTLLDDSKKLVAHGDIALAEAWARALIPSASSPRELVEAISLDDKSTLEAPCPSGLATQCWGLDRLSFHASDAQLARVRDRVETLRTAGFSLTSIRSVLVCPSRLLDQIVGTRSIYHADLLAMERLLEAMRERAGEEVEAVCGKVGGLGKYLPHLRRLTAPATIEHEVRARATYRIAGFGRVSFVMDADATEPLVAIASLVGKYVREITMGTITGYYRSKDPSLDDVSGYHDPVTRKFVLATAKIREDEQVPDRCFLRPRKAR